MKRYLRQIILLTLITTCLSFLLYFITDYSTAVPDDQNEGSLLVLLTGFVITFIECFLFVNLSLFYNHILLKTSILKRRTFPRLLLHDTLLLMMNVATAYAISILILTVDKTEIPYFNQNLYVFSIIVTFISGIYTNSWLLDTANSAEMKSMKLEIQLLNESQKAEKARADLLKMQIDPHFMFNNFSILIELIEQEPKVAVKFLSQLSKIYRYVISNSRNDLVSTNEELAFLSSYAYMIDIRYDNDVEIIVDPSLKDVKGYLPPVCLQLLVENAIKHNKYNDSKHLHIRLSADTENIIVENDFRPLEYATPSTGIGIKNIFSRYAILTDRKPVFLQTGEKYIVKLPIIFKKNEDTDY